MKKVFYLLASLTILGVFKSSGQSINGVALKDIEARYIMVLGVGSAINNNLKVQVDFGQKVDALIFRDKEMAVKDEKGEKVYFNSMIDALNFFKKMGTILRQRVLGSLKTY